MLSFFILAFHLEEHLQPAHIPFRPLREMLIEKCFLYGVLSLLKRTSR